MQQQNQHGDNGIDHASKKEELMGFFGEVNKKLFHRKKQPQSIL